MRLRPFAWGQGDERGAAATGGYVADKADAIKVVGVVGKEDAAASPRGRGSGRGGSGVAAAGGQVADKADAVTVVGVVGDEDMAPLPRGADAEGEQAQGMQVCFLHAIRFRMVLAQ